MPIQPECTHTVPWNYCILSRHQRYVKNLLVFLSSSLPVFSTYLSHAISHFCVIFISCQARGKSECKRNHTSSSTYVLQYVSWRDLPIKPSLGFSYCKHKSWVGAWEWGYVGPTCALDGLVPWGQWLLWSIASIVSMRMKQGFQLLRTAFSSMSRKLLAPHLVLGDILVIPSTDATQLKGCHACLHETRLSCVSCKLCWTFLVNSLATLHCKPFSLLV